jgi:phage gpG-like protein
MTGVTMKLLGQDAALGELDGYIARAENPRPMFESIGAMLVTSTQHRFDTGKAVDKSPWPPSLRVLAHGGKTLILSTRLYRSFSYQAFATGLEFGTNVIYAALLQFGGDVAHKARQAVLNFKTNKRSGQTRFAKEKRADYAQKVTIGAHTVHMPARPFVGLDEDDDRAIIRIGEAYIAGEAKAP